MSNQELQHCKNCWYAFVKMSTDAGHHEIIKKAEMMVSSLGAVGTYAMCGFEDKALPEKVKQIIADGLMYLETLQKEQSTKN